MLRLGLGLGLVDYRRAGRTIGVELEHALDEELVRLLMARLKQESKHWVVGYR